MTAPDDGLEALLAEHETWWNPTTGSSGCSCGHDYTSLAGYAQEKQHYAAVVRAAGWVKGREEWGVEVPLTPSHHRIKPHVGEDSARWYVENSDTYGPGTVVRRTVTDWEEA